MAGALQQFPSQDGENSCVVLIGHGLFIVTERSFFQLLEAECLIWFVKLSLEILLMLPIINTLVPVAGTLGLMETDVTLQKQVFLFGKAKCLEEK